MKGACEVDDCGQARQYRKYCAKHYQRWRTHGDPLFAKVGPDSKTGVCEFPLCPSTDTSVARRAHLCVEHAAEVDAQVQELSREIVSVGFQQGYIFGSTRGARSRIALHRLIMEERLGRTLRPGETVHHRNGSRTDNSPDNLELWLKGGQPSGQRVLDKLVWARWLLEQYD